MKMSTGETTKAKKTKLSGSNCCALEPFFVGLFSEFF